MAYRSYYKTPKKTRIRTPLNSELQNLQEELQELQSNITRPQQRRQNSFADLERFFMDKFILIGGCIAIGIGIGYLLFKSKHRC